MNNENLGQIPCPVCGFDCDLKVTKKGKAYVNCGECGSQTFARGMVADKKLRDKLAKIENAAAAPAAAVDIPAPQSKPKAAPAVTVTRHSSEGQTVKAEKTVFDYLNDFARGTE